MKTTFTLSLFFIALFMCSYITTAQITITSADVSVAYATGRVIKNNLDTTTTSVNIGSPGATSWDFSNLKSHLQMDHTYVTPSSTPFATDFPNSNMAITFAEIFMEEAGEGWTFQTHSNDSLKTDGTITRMDIENMLVVTKVINSPAALDVKLPCTFNNQWTSAYVSSNTTYFDGIPFITTYSNIYDTVVVDAYGPMTLPGGIVMDALRIRSKEVYSTLGMNETTISYFYIAKNGSGVQVAAKDSTHGNSGNIQIEEATWYLVGPPVGINSNDPSPSLFSVSQNYPNPFNSTTKICYSLPIRSKVELRLFDSLGKEVAVIVNEKQLPGQYEVEFDAVHLKRGVYFYKITAGHFTDTKKMIILK